MNKRYAFIRVRKEDLDKIKKIKIKTGWPLIIVVSHLIFNYLKGTKKNEKPS